LRPENGQKIRRYNDKRRRDDRPKVVKTSILLKKVAITPLAWDNPSTDKIISTLEAMMVDMRISYEGGLRCSAVHGPSGSTILTDAPKDNHGKGEAFSPTDLVGAALGACMLTTMAIVAERKGIDLRGATVKVVKEMVADPTRRIGRLTVEFDLPAGLTAEQQQMLENAANSCPVHKSLAANMELPVVFAWK